MLFNSHQFLFLFLPVTVVVFYVLASHRGERMAKLWLVAASLFFYGCWNFAHIALLLASMLFNYVLGRWIFSRATEGRSIRIPLGLGVCSNLLALGYFKYSNFFLENIGVLFGLDWVKQSLLLPLGISFFTFTQIAYLCDSRFGKAGNGSLSDFFLFVTFFPHLIAGPVIHHAEMMPQFSDAKTYRFDWDRLAAGLTLFILGLGKKCLIADGIGPTAAKVFGAAEAGHRLFPSDAWAGALAYTFQLYFDFSGYSDMAIGLAKMFGIILPLNFLSPYQAENIAEFWRRWHMTLSRFLREYLYIPLGGNRVGPWRNYANLVGTMILGGLWHGAAWTFVLWGAFHGLLLAIHRVWAGYFPAKGRLVWVGRGVTFGMVVLGWVLFRAESVSAAGVMFGSMFHWIPAPELGVPSLVKSKLWIWLTLLLVAVWVLPNSAQLCDRLLPYSETARMPSGTGLERWRVVPSLGWAMVLVLIFSIALLKFSNTGEFLYYNF